MPLTAAEQLLLELINRARLDPATEAARLGVGLNAGLAAGTIGTAAQQVLAPNAALEAAADAHSQWMLDTDTFSHTGAGGSTAYQRMVAAGYSFTGNWQSAENLALSVGSGGVDLNAAIVAHYEGLFASAGHRANTLDAGLREIGIGQREGDYVIGGHSYSASALTETFAVSGTRVFLTGVAHADADSDAFYDIGEGLAGIGVSLASGAGTVTGSAGGYALGLAPDAAADVIVQAADGTELARLQMDLSQGNGKLDVIRAPDGVLELALSVSAVLEQGIGQARLLGLANLNLTGHDAANRLTGNAGNNLLDGGSGDDTLIGAAGSDGLTDGAGSDMLTGGTGADRFVLVADGAEDVITDLVQAEDHIDLTGWAGLTGLDQLVQSAVAGGVRLTFGTETLIVQGSGVAVGTLAAAQFSFGSAPPPVFEEVPGSEQSDLLEGGAGAQRLSGLAGHDRLFGFADNDSLVGGEGNDLLDGGAGGDTLEGGLGNDSYIVDSTGDVVQGELAFGAGGGIDTVFTSVNFTAPANVELVRAQAGAGNLSLTGNDAPGTLVGNEGNNTLNGRGGNDQINGNAGNDTIIGGEGRDTLVGGLGADTFVFSAVSNSRAGSANRDVINGFTRSPADQDRIDLSAIDANTLTPGVNDAFSFIGTAAFSTTGSAGQLRLVGLGGANAVVVEADINGDRVADFQIFINGQTTMVMGDFIL